MAAQHGDGTATQLRLHGRGGQGTVTAAELLAVAAFEDGLYAQAFPSFGSERMGAPVEAYCRVGSKPIRTREPVARPDVVIVQDPTLLGQVNLFGGLTSSGFVIVNASRPVQELDLDGLMGLIPLTSIVSVPATRIALEHVGRPTPNSALLGALSALTGLISPAGIIHALEHRFAPAIADANSRAVREAYDVVVAERGEVISAAAN